MSGRSTETAGAGFQPQTSIRDYFAGAWKLVSTEKKYPDGHAAPFSEFGVDAVGFLLYTPSGHMCAQLMKSGREEQSDAANSPASSLHGFMSYCGTYEVREHEQTMIHRPETAWAPDWVGTVQVRPFHLVSPDRFFFHGTEDEKQEDGTVTAVIWSITWERLK